MCKFLTFFILSVFFTISVDAQFRSIEWIATLGSEGSDHASAFCMDSSGHYYVAGNLRGGKFNTQAIRYPAFEDDSWFIAKYNSFGLFESVVFLWSENEMQINDICTDPDGKILIAGYYTETLFIEGKLRAAAEKGTNPFLIKMDSAFVFLWSADIQTRPDSTEISEATALCKDLQGHILICGSLGAPTDFGADISIDSTNGNDIFLAQYSPDGACQWVKTAGGSGFDIASDICSFEGDIFIAGNGGSNIEFENHISISGFLPENIFLARYGPSGNCLWASGGNGWSDSKSISLDISNKGNVFLAGTFFNWLEFGQDIKYRSKGSSDIFIAGFSPAGQFFVARQIETYSNHISGNIVAHGSSIYIGGGWTDSLLINGYLFLSNNDLSINNYASFIAKFDESLNSPEVGIIDSEASELCSRLLIFPGNEIAVLGEYEPDLLIESGGRYRPGYGAKDIFLTRFRPCGPGSFDYNGFFPAADFSTAGTAKLPDSSIILTESEKWSAGALWHKQKLPLYGFTAEFSFSFSEGSNDAYDDGSSPGADGIAFVIQNNSPNALGGPGYGLGFRDIPSSFAIEIDTYANDSLALDDMHDPDGNHIAVFSRGSAPNTCNHSSDACLGTTGNLEEIISDGRAYRLRADYSLQDEAMEIYFGSGNDLGAPVLAVENLNLVKILELDNDAEAWMGFTSSTGNAYQKHEILYWSFCSDAPEQTTGSRENTQTRIKHLSTKAVPNPFYDDVEIFYHIYRGSKASLKIYDIYGNILANMKKQMLPAGNYSFHWDATYFATGVFIYLLEAGEYRCTGKILKIK